MAAGSRLCRTPIFNCFDPSTSCAHQAPAWDDLSAAQPIGQRHAPRRTVGSVPRTFRAPHPLGIVVVRDQGRLVAALPLVGRGPKLLRVGGLPGNAWSSAGTLLVDPNAGRAALDHLTAFFELGWPLLLLGTALPGDLGLAGLPPRARSSWHAAGRAASLSCRHDSGWTPPGKPTWPAAATIIGGRCVACSTGPPATCNCTVLDQLTAGDVVYWLLVTASPLKTAAGRDAPAARCSRMGTRRILLFAASPASGREGRAAIGLSQSQGRRGIAVEYGWQAKGVYFSR